MDHRGGCGGPVALGLAFFAGALLTLGLRDLYPDLGLLDLLDLLRLRGPSARSAARAAAGGGGTDIVSGIEGTIGNTALLELRSLSAATGRTILGKAEFLNGAGNSPKDRVALAIIDAAEAAGRIVPGRGDTIYEGTVGSTGIAIAALARARGYAAHICMPDDQSAEKAELLRHLGAAVERVPVAPITSPGHYVNVARRRAGEHARARADGSVGYFADQFSNPANVAAHEHGTGPEIVRQTGGRIDAFVAGAGTGGTIAGVARHLKGKSGGGGGGSNSPAPGVRVVLADPQGSGLYHRVRHGVMYAPTEREGTRRRRQVDSVVEGIGINRVVANFEAGGDLVDDAVRVTDGQACAMAAWLAARDGVFVGSSSAVNCVGAVVAAMAAPAGGVVVTVLCDSGARHLSKFWTRIGEMGRPIGPADNLFDVLGLARPLSGAGARHGPETGTDTGIETDVETGTQTGRAGKP